MGNMNADLSANMIPVTDPTPVVIASDSDGVTFGTGYPGYLGDGSFKEAVAGPAGVTPSLVSAGYLGQTDDAAIPADAMLRNTSEGWAPNPAYGGVPGRTNRLAFDIEGPATSTVVESFRMDGSRIKPGRPDLARGGPVGASGDLGQFLAVAMAQSTYDFPAQDLAQLNVLLGL